MFIWHSRLNAPTIYPVAKDPFNISLDENNGVLIIASHDATAVHYTTLLFFGSDARANVDKWDQWGKEENIDDRGEERLHLNTSTKEAIQRCFGLS